MTKVNVIGEIRAILSKKPTTNSWWKLVELIELAKADEREFVQDYVMAHVNKTNTWKMASVPCGEWSEDSLGWSLSTVMKESVTGLEEAEVVWCPAGSFQMGACEEDDEADSYEKPQHKVILSRGFWIWDTPITQGQFEAIMKFNPAGFKDVGLDAPVERVSWYDAVAFCNALSEKSGLEAAYALSGKKGKVGSDDFSFEVEWNREANGWRLPTEAEWEYAARAGCGKSRYGELDDIAWYDDNSDFSTHVVREKTENAWGLHDTLGSVWEWCYDFWTNYKRREMINPVCDVGLSRILRGGDWGEDSKCCRFSNRYNDAPSNRDYDFDEDDYDILGFRLVRS